MKFDKLIEDGFVVNEREIGGETCYLVFPRSIAVKMTPDTMIYRSSIWNAAGKAVSLGYKKFFNYGESPHLVRDPTDADLKLSKGQVLAKLDGSCLIVSCHNGELIIRTRGVFDAREQGTGDEIPYLQEKYPEAFSQPDMLDGTHSYLYEWTTRANRIVIDYGDDPDIFLIGKIRHSDYRYSSQADLDALAVTMAVKRPGYLEVENMTAIFDALADMRYAEGYCLYFNEGQDIKKLKCEWYLAAHRFKNDCNVEFILDLFLSMDCPTYEAFMKTMQELFDFECVPEAIGFASKVCDSYKTAKRIMEHMEEFVNGLKNESREDRKHAASMIQQAYGITNRASFAFCMLDGKELTKDQVKKLVMQSLK